MADPDATILIGTSGWSYGHWKGTFYPKDLADGERLGFYARHLDSVEINSSFYRLPSAQALAQALAHWRDSVPDHFRFAVKASRYITPIEKLEDNDQAGHAAVNACRLRRRFFDG